MNIKKWNELPGSSAVQGWPYTNLHDLNLDWIINTTKEFAAEISRFEDNVTSEVGNFENSVTVKIGEFEGTMQEYTSRMDTALATVDEKITYIDNFFSSLDVQQEINNKLDSMSADGSLAALLKPFADAWLAQDAPGVISAWLEAHITEPEGVVIDSSLSVAGAAADAKATGAAVEENARAVNILRLTWESGGINNGTGVPAPTNTRVRSPLFTTHFAHVICKRDVTTSETIEIYRYSLTDQYIDYAYTVAQNNTLVTYTFDSEHKYRIVLRDINNISSFIEADPNTIYLSRGAISDDGSVQTLATHTIIYRYFSVAQPKIITFTTPNAKTRLFVYDNDNLRNILTYNDRTNNTAYFPLTPGFRYRLYCESSSLESCSFKIDSDPVPQLYNGGIADGVVIKSEGNTRTNLIPRKHKFVSIFTNERSYIVKFKNSQFLSKTSIYSDIFSPAIINIEDCDAFYLISNQPNDNIDYVQTADEPLYNKKWCSYGDSITAQERWQPYIVAKYHLTLQNKGVGGSCITGITACSTTPMTDESRINSIDADTDIITVMGGTNDFDYCTNIGNIASLQTTFDLHTFIGSIAYIVKKLQKRCPNAKIYLMSNINSRGASTGDQDNQQISPYGYTPFDFAVAVKNVAEWLSIEYIDSWSCGINQMNRSRYTDGSVHPNTAGGKLIAEKVMEHFKLYHPIK